MVKTKELDGMGYFELSVFSFEITRGLLKAGDMKKIKRARPVNKVTYIILSTLFFSRIA